MNLNKFLQGLNKIGLEKDIDTEFYTIPGSLYYFFIFENSKIKIGHNINRSKDSYWIKQYDLNKGLYIIKTRIREIIDP